MLLLIRDFVALKDFYGSIRFLVKSSMKILRNFGEDFLGRNKCR